MQFEDMEVWKRSARLSVEVYRQLGSLTDFGFKDQITRAGLSISSNIAEGFGRETDRDKKKFLSYAKGSCAELKSQTYIGIRVGYIPRPTGEKWVRESEELSAMLGSLMKYLTK